MSRREKDEYTSFIALTRELLNDPTWKKLSPKAKLVWIYLRREYRGGYDPSIRLGPAKVKDSMSDTSCRRAIKELKSVGWLVVDYDKAPNRNGTAYFLLGPHSYFIFNGFKVQYRG